MKVTIDTTKLARLSHKADKIFLSQDGEKNLYALLEIKDRVDQAIAEAKKQLEAAALQLNPNFSSIEGDSVKVFYRSYGSRYSIDQSRLADVPKELYAVQTKILPDNKAIAALQKSSGNKLPIGIIEKDRPKSITFTKKK